MSGPCTPYSIRRQPCVACGATRTIRWAYGGQVYCHDGIACGRRMARAWLATPRYVHHIDGDPTNNDPANLRLVKA